MAKKPNFQLTDKHRTSLGEIVNQSNTVVVFGKIVKDLPPTPQGQNFAQIFGYKRNNVCSKLPSPLTVALPDPDGPSDDCGWDPQEFVKWELPTSFISTQLHVRTVVLTQALTSSTASGLTGAQLSVIVSGSIRAVTGSTLPLIASQSLQIYGILGPQQVAQLNATIAGMVSQENFTLANNALAGMTPSTTIGQLEAAISDGAKPNV